MVTTFTFVRHGESTDNVRSVWAGWKDAPLSNHGMNQARALAAAFESTSFTAIHASSLKRAQMTAQAIHDAQKSPKPTLVISPLLREQNFGIAEGKPWVKERLGVSLEDHFAKGLYPKLRDRTSKFPEGESLEELRCRAEQVMREILFPYIWKTKKEGGDGASVVVNFGGGHAGNTYVGLRNTAWTRVTVQVKGAEDGDCLEFSDDELPPLEVCVTNLNRYEHTKGIVRQKGGIGSTTHDSTQKDIRTFFGRVMG